MAETVVDLTALPTAERHELLSSFYDRLMVPNFPPAELLPLATLQEGIDAQPVTNPVMLTLDDSGEAVAGVVGEWFPDSGTLLVAYVVVSLALRGHGLGSALLTATLPRWHRSYQPAALLAEVEDPRVFGPSAGQDPAARVRLYARLGARLLDLRYVQPEVQPGWGRVADLLLITSPSHSAKATGDGLPAPLLASFLHEYYRHAEGDGYADAEFDKLLAELSARPMTRFLPLHAVLTAEPSRTRAARR